MAKEEYLGKIVTALSGVNQGKAPELSHIKRIANALEGVTKASGKSVVDMLSSTGITEITHDELVALRDAGKLKPGELYRITDYVATTTQNETQSANHPFDIIVSADSANTLNENAKAAIHETPYIEDSEIGTGSFLFRFPDNDDTELGLYGWSGVDGIVYTKTLTPVVGDLTYNNEGGIYGEVITVGFGDEYFSPYDAKLEAWKLKYCLDNDRTRFAWADEENGKGVIYWMKDEFNNECPYDFKNIQFKRFALVSYSGSGGGSIASALLYSNTHKYFGCYNVFGLEVPQNFNFDTSQYGWYYTFSGLHNDYSIYDMSVERFKLSQQTIEDAENDDSGLDTEDSCYDNVIKPFNKSFMCDDLYNIGKQSLNNIVFIGNVSYDDGYDEGYSTSKICANVFDTDCFCNTFGNRCLHNIFGMSFNFNTFSNNCFFNTFGNDCNNNIFGKDFYSNTFGDHCTSNTFGNSCNNNTFGNNCMTNILGDSFLRNTFGKDCSSNTFGNGCNNNTFGNNCLSNIFVINCCYNIFGYGCTQNLFADSCTYNIFGNNCANNILMNAKSNFVTVYSNTSGPINVAADVDYPQFVGKDSSGTVRVWTIDDIINA